MADAMKAAWAEAKQSNPLTIAPTLILPPMAQAAVGALALARKLKGARIEAALRVRIDLGLRVTPKGAAAIAFVRQGDVAGGISLN